jgi:hypothetical protein
MERLLTIGQRARAASVPAWDGFRFEVVDTDGHRVNKVLAVPAEAASAKDAP